MTCVNAEMFDPFRFARMHVDRDRDRVKHKVVKTSVDYISFGHGKHAWYVDPSFPPVPTSKARTVTATNLMAQDGLTDDGGRSENIYHRSGSGSGPGSGSGQAPELNELVLVHLSTSQNSPEAMRTEFVNSMLRTKSKAQKDAVIATSLMPVAYAVDVRATLIWPFNGLAEIDGIWA
ncbi:hypothetical protein DICSQDRAFT_181776 [Dichomitus squalens LYAD-421 SS1]|uniref:Uncharacterized protein n=1 Tax=Dichomitus squalens (strain LYAD-421) TaxID=732165 RepID=R7SVN1_DICSQ|nr:uncharacterized protein DICSQDRAFT_181776 [Dichomitus squalens LYAD-421 SS1]EJF59820.1 hypothetical protein DICSQDRAFT_181776 [Dichomitus squalens LYAD-421 SS1]